MTARVVREGYRRLLERRAITAAVEAEAGSAEALQILPREGQPTSPSSTSLPGMGASAHHCILQRRQTCILAWRTRPLFAAPGG